MVYYCEYPNCEYKTESRNKINHHHIVPKELQGTDLLYNKVYLCPTHHSLVYIPESKSGNHSIRTKDSFQILGIVSSTAGFLLNIIDSTGNETFAKLKNV